MKKAYNRRTVKKQAVRVALGSSNKKAQRQAKLADL